jgi:hypothetical protein
VTSCKPIGLSALRNDKPTATPAIVGVVFFLRSGHLYRSLHFTGATTHLHSWRVIVAPSTRFIASRRFIACCHADREWGAVKKNEKTRKEWVRKKEKRKEGKRKNRLSDFLEIVIDNLYLLCYY